MRQDDTAIFPLRDTWLPPLPMLPLLEHVFQSIKRQLATVFSLLAPLLVGPLSSLLSSVPGI